MTTLVAFGGHYLMPDSREGGRIHVLAGLAPSSQTVAFITEDPGATKGGSCRLSMKMSVDELTPSKLMNTVDELGCR